eukprot:365643-Chlamydomonas_euryale.AAC.21
MRPGQNGWSRTRATIRQSPGGGAATRVEMRAAAQKGVANDMLLLLLLSGAFSMQLGPKHVAGLDDCCAMASAVPCDGSSRLPQK